MSKRKRKRQSDGSTCSGNKRIRITRADGHLVCSTITSDCVVVDEQCKEKYDRELETLCGPKMSNKQTLVASMELDE